jgi:glycosyltransferase involved in cell wall biosynthesis
MDKMTNYQKIWESTNYKSDIYTELSSFLEETREKNATEVSSLLREKISDAYTQKKLDFCLLWLNEYQLINKNDDFSNCYEVKIENFYNQELKKVNRPCLFFQRDAQNILELEFFQNRYAGDRCFILGNGQSLNKVDISLLKDEFTFGVNSIFLARENMGYAPTFYCVEDTHVASERKNEIQSIDSPVKFFGHYLKNSILPNPHNIFLNILMDYRRYAGFPYFSIDASRRLWVGGTVSYINMQMAYYFGFKKVYLIGFDHEYVIPSSAEAKGVNIRSTTDDPNHFHPDYFGKNFHWHIPLVNRMELSYIKAKRAFELDGREIVNCTPGGKLEVFRRENFADVLAAAKGGEKIPSDAMNYAHSRIAPLKKGNIITKKPFFSIIVPAYNAEATLASAVGSAIRQSLPNDYYEIIIVDDGSTDGTFYMMEKMQRLSDNIHIYRNSENRGQGTTRNFAISMATGEYITFLDADDRLRSDALEKFYHVAKGKNFHIIYSNFLRMSYHGEPLNSIGPLRHITKNVKHETVAGKRTFCAFAAIYNRQYIKDNNINFSNGIFYEDIIFSVHAVILSERVAHIPECLYYWIVRNCSTTTSISSKKIMDSIQAMEQVYALLERSGTVNEYRADLMFAVQNWLRLIEKRIHIFADKKNKTPMLKMFVELVEQSSILGELGISAKLLWDGDAFPATESKLSLDGSADILNMAEAAAGAVVMIASTDTHFRDLAAISLQLKKKGIPSVLFDISRSKGVPSGRSIRPGEVETYADIISFSIDTDSISPFFPNARAYLFANDWSKQVRPILFQATLRNIPTIVLYEGVDDDLFIDPPDPPRTKPFPFGLPLGHALMHLHTNADNPTPPDERAAKVICDIVTADFHFFHKRIGYLAAQTPSRQTPPVPQKKQVEKQQKKQVVKQPRHVKIMNLYKAAPVWKKMLFLLIYDKKILWKDIVKFVHARTGRRS